MHKSTLEQWGLLDEVVRHGSFANAAEANHRSQSSVSYNLAMLQERLGVTLLETQGRRTVLTPAGEELLAQVRPLLKAFYTLEKRAIAIQNGERSRIELVVDSILPRENLFSVLREFQRRYPRTQVNVTEVLETQVPDSDHADVLVLSQRQPGSGRGEWLMNVDFVAVAHHAHPLLQQDGVISAEQLAAYPLIRIADSQHFSVLQERNHGEVWSCSTIEAAIEAVTHQVGFGWLPETRIQAALAAGTLKVLPLQQGVRRATALHLLINNHIIVIDASLQTLLNLLREQSWH
ncbi:LysR family transcriptional regulator [Pantoea sp. Acro-805]|uniref:LysR family transcriptional regulator n=1 Tax=Candidatus Pantoea formicae TaxID=2608355 RepID=A0ABX0QUG7_9GAMM|nr:LysR family transcriptional regulator [Pantoea formicae]MDF7650395.1 LysR family transcriptional regulator [Erwiniaceae bacterium L1_54_3]NIF00677.1 LysR family transcriptional regulator [Pantoea formicae]